MTSQAQYTWLYYVQSQARRNCIRFTFKYANEVLTSRSPPYQCLRDSNDSSFFSFAFSFPVLFCHLLFFLSDENLFELLCARKFLFFCCSGYVLKSFLCCQLALCLSPPPSFSAENLLLFTVQRGKRVGSGGCFPCPICWVPSVHSSSFSHHTISFFVWWGNCSSASAPSGCQKGKELGMQAIKCSATSLYIFFLFSLFLLLFFFCFHVFFTLFFSNMFFLFTFFFFSRFLSFFFFLFFCFVFLFTLFFRFLFFFSFLIRFFLNNNNNIINNNINKIK